MRWLSLMTVVLVGWLSMPVDGTRAADDPHAGTHAAGDHAAGEDSHAHDHAHVGEPATEPAVFNAKDWRFDLSVYSLVVFLLLLTVLSKFAWGPVISALDTREENIRRNIEEAEVARVRSEQLLAERAAKLDGVQDEVREILAEARRDAEHTKADIMAAAQREAEATKRRALDEVDRARDQALNELFGTMAAQVTQATEHVLGRALTDEDRTRLVSQSLAELAGQN